MLYNHLDKLEEYIKQANISGYQYMTYIEGD